MTLLLGDCLEHLKSLEANSVDSLVTDPPAGISFMGKSWDHDLGGRLHWIAWMTLVMAECLRVMKPGAHGLVWALPRTSHWTATALEEAGFEVRDVVTHHFGSGFPKSLDVSKAIDKAAGAEREIVGYGCASEGGTVKRKPRAMSPDGSGKRETIATITVPSTDAAKLWDGWGTALKPAHETWWLIRKPCSEKTVAANVLRWGTGALNIDASRIGYQSEADKAQTRVPVGKIDSGNNGRSRSGDRSETFQPSAQGRFPANLVFSCPCDSDQHLLGCAVGELDRQSGTSKSTGGGMNRDGRGGNNAYAKHQGHEQVKDCGKGDSGGASRFFYCAKISKSERGVGNNHPTVKSGKLMRYLITMITPPGGTVLDPFAGSGSTLLAAKSLGFPFIGIEKEAEYFEIAKRRIGQ